VARKRFRMTRVPVPEWAPSYDRGEAKFEMDASKYSGAITPEERQALMQRHADILALTDKLVEKYANDGCAPPGEDWFPEQAKLTGEFYVGGESYHRLPGQSWIQICIRARCIGRRMGDVGDYLGLDVWLRYEPKSGQLSNHRNTDSMVI
jgi:hypothetical protein